MTPGPATADLEPFFERYAAAFDAFDAQAVAAFLHCPCLMVNAEHVVPLTTPDAILANMRAVLRHHRAQGYARAAVSDVTELARSEGLAIVRVRWRVHRADETLLWDWLNSYQLVRAADADGWRIAVSTTH